MFNKKLKKVACLTLATVLAFSGVQAMQIKNVEAAVDIKTPGTQFATFADAVEAMYNGKVDFVTGEYELATFYDDYDYSVTKRSRITNFYRGDSVTEQACYQSMLWDAPGRKVKSITVKENCEDQPVTVIGKNGEQQTLNWNYTVASITFSSYDGSGFDTVQKILNVRPSSKVSGKVILPAYITTKNLGTLECIELGDGAFLKSDITSVEIPSTYQRLCAYAFTGCTKLTEVNFTKVNSQSGNSYTIDNSVSSDEVLENYSNLHFMGTGLFAGCTSLTKAIMPSKLVEGYVVKNSDGKYSYAGASVESTKNQRYQIVTPGGGQILNSSSWAVYTHVSNNGKAGATYGAESNINIPYIEKKGSASENSTYFMGDGIYRDCYSLEEVTIGGVNPFIPTNTFAGCAALENVTISDSVELLYFGVSCFAGSNSNSGVKSSLKSLNLNTPNLREVYLGAYAFKNCTALESVNITGVLNGGKSANPYSILYQGKTFNSESVFENAFSVGGSFVYKPKTDSRNFALEEKYFKNCSGLQTIDINAGGNSIDKGWLTVCNEALYNVGVKELTLGQSWGRVNVETGSLTGLFNTDTLTFKSGAVTLEGEPFSNSNYAARTLNSNNLKNVVFDCSSLQFLEDEIICKKRYKTTASFYGLGSDTILTFGKDFKSFYGSLSNVEKVSEITNYGLDATYGVNQDWSHSAMGEVQKVYIKSYNLKFDNDAIAFIPPYVLSTDTELGLGFKTLNTTIYADGNAYNSLVQLKSRVDSKIASSGNTDDKNQLIIKEYTSGLESVGVEWVETKKEFDPSIVNDGKGMKILYVDGTSDFVEYSNESGNTGTNGYVVLGSIDSDSIKAGNKFSLSANYRDKVGSINVTVVPQKAIEMTVTSAGAVVAGTEPKASDVKISEIKFNDGTTADVADGNVSVKLVNGLRYTAGSNAVEVTYKGLTKQLILQATAEEVVSMGAIQLRDKIYPGDTISKSDISVTAYYNSGKVEKGFIDYTIVNSEVTDSNDTIVLRSSNGVESTVKLNVTGLEPRAISVAYNGKPVQAGGVVAKSNFTVTIVYNNGTTRVLKDDEYDLVYAPIIGNTSNSVKVVYKADESICETVYVTGVAEDAPIVSDAPGVVPTNVPGDNGNGSVVIPTNVPGGNENGNGSGVAPTNVPGEATKTPSSDAPKATDKPSSTATASPSVSPTGTPGQVLDLGKLPGTNVSGSSIEVKTNETTKNVTLGVGEKLTVKMSGTGVTYTSSDANVLQVSDTGLVKAKKVGKAQIVVTDSSNNKKTVVITVKKAPKAIKVNFKKKTLKKGKTVKIKVSFAKGYYSYSRKFSSSNKKVATVSSKGVIKAKKKGKCKITVKAFNGKKAVITITVK